MNRVAQSLWCLATVAVLGLSPATAYADPPAAPSGQLGDLTGISADGTTVTLASGSAAVRVSFPADGAVRVWLAPDGSFTDPAGSKIVLPKSTPPATPKRVDKGAYWAISTPKATLRAYKHPLKFALYDGADRKQLWAESAPLSWTGSTTTQSLTRTGAEQFVGGGEQNGRYSHRDQTIKIFADDNWNDGGAPNSQPFYASTAGYGVLRNTFAPGSYSFTDPVETTHDERRFDATYVVGNTLKDVIGGYTDLVGKPFLPPIYGLETGDSDCYLHNANRGERHTLDAVKVADGYAANDMPNGWMLVNDGYGCGYENLPQTGEGLRKDNMQLGLWTENGVPNQAEEVKAGVRVRKLDVAWVGPGYQFALDACDTAHKGIEDNSDARGFVWQPVSWAGAQRCGVLWSGDQSGSYDYIKWQIPTYAGATTSGIAYNTGDIDGIFGGSPQTYVRDLQWKAFLPTAMTMDGWASSDKQPWQQGEPYTSINRKYLMLKERLLPYTYSYSAQAHQTGVGQVRPLALEYPDDPNVWTDKAKYEFLSGTDFLVAPVYEKSNVRNGIYLPQGAWVDYWSGKTYTGPATVDGYDAPLDTLPLFVRAGAVVPMWADGTKSWQTRDKSLLDLDVYPQAKGSFTLTEDDGVTRGYQRGEQAKQTFTVDAPKSGPGTVTVGIGASAGTYPGKPAARSYQLSVHTGTKPALVQAGAGILRQYGSKAELDKAASGWWYDPAAHGVVRVKTGPVGAGDRQDVRLFGASAVGGFFPEDDNGTTTLTMPSLAAPGQATAATVSFTNGTPLPVRDVVLSVQGNGFRADVPALPKVVRPGQTVKVPVTLTPDAGLKPADYQVTASTSYRARLDTHQAVDSSTVTVPYASLAAAASNIGVTDAGHVTAGDLDGGGSSFRAEGLAEAGLKPGAAFSALGASLTWPDAVGAKADNVVAAGQTVAVKGAGSRLVLAGTGTGTAKGTVVVQYADGSTSQADLGFPNWCCADPAQYGATTVATVLGKNTHTGAAYPTTPYRVFANSVPLTAGKEVVAVTLPSNSALHVFAASVA
ncbi:glycoside hydrolase family 31 protein [Amycolatopsis sp., V23-08]|uniref:Glycoside hydrolase family 31 protein n=1 Tax=Amycolatopsis heterodermiae TaxID=3110235 RepID=A0ABU5QWT1_9PSEU|nr:TIM-barrel domain-containing protein [Amycolatopsis sp., V23-08]MEA5358064.1 glycoside hydrolase family 31 protein [Amycolatopsis sp., V23-08]